MAHKETGMMCGVPERNIYIMNDGDTIEIAPKYMRKVKSVRTGKTYIAAGLCFDAVERGYRAYFKSMEDVVQVLKMKDITRKAAIEYKRIIKSHLLVIDDIMMFPITKNDAVSFFNLVNELHEKTSIIITTNKSPKQWTQVLEDEIITTALLDRILYQCEVIKLNGSSFRMKNRKTIFINN
jgi:DNA replication protein DnaC